MPAQWEVIRIWCGHIYPPHDKYCVIVSAEEGWCFFINSDPPAFRKARTLAVEISNFEASFLKHTSFIDTTSLQVLDPAAIAKAHAEPERCCGALIKTVRRRVVQAVNAHGALTAAQREAILGS